MERHTTVGTQNKKNINKKVRLLFGAGKIRKSRLLCGIWVAVHICNWGLVFVSIYEKYLSATIT